MQAQSLRQLIDRAVARDGYIGMSPFLLLPSFLLCRSS